jgi:hypothetical protein
MLALPAASFEARRVAPTRANSLSLVRFDANDYWVPPAHAHHELTVTGAVEEVRISEGARLAAVHRRGDRAIARELGLAHVALGGSDESSAKPCAVTMSRSRVTRVTLFCDHQRPLSQTRSEGKKGGRKGLFLMPGRHVHATLHRALKCARG